MVRRDDDSEEVIDSLLAAVARIPSKDPHRRPTEWTPPGELDEYRLIRPLGRGGMGSVWLAEDRLLERLVAVKFIAHAEPDPSTRARFAIEARAAARLQHENVVTVHRYGELSGRPYLISEYIRGDSLDTLAKPLPWPRAVELGVGLARGLAAAHRHGIVHRDIKPANAIVTPDGQAKLVDFGLAKIGFTDPAATTVSIHDPIANLTVPGAIAGTPRYLAPEVRIGDPATRRSDVYQLGCILYELVAGRAPIFELRGGAAATCDEDVPSLQARLGPMGARFAAVVDRCLRRDPNERYASGEELREALEQIAAPAPGGELPDGNPYRGLLAFDAEHRALFFGRGPDIRAVIERLRAERFVLVTGDSGVGKSSLCRAGVLPHIAAGSIGSGVVVIQLLPGRKPAAGLASALSELLGLEDTAVAAFMREDPTQLLRELRRAKREVVVFVDQLEEITTVADRAEAELFATTLGHLVDGAPAVRVLATVRSDFVTRVAELPAIGGDLARALYVLRPLTEAGAREAVVGPARAKGARFESDQLVDAIAAQAVELPLLAFTLAQLWEVRDVATQAISARSLDAIGGVRGALARHADGVLDSLLPAQRTAARKLLLRLVTAERTRIRRTADELVAVEPAVLDALVRGRLVIARGGDTPTFELVHEKLIDGWPALAEWLTQTTEAIAVHARLAVSVVDWERLQHSRDALWSERQLADLAIVPADELTATERAFVDASRRAMSRRRFRRRGLAVAIPLAIASIYIGGRVIARRDLASHVADHVADAERRLEVARAAAADDAKLQREAFELFDANDGVRGEVTWAAASERHGAAESEYAAAAQMLEAAFLLDTDRDDVRRELARVTYERLLLADRDRHVSEAHELATRLALYDDDGELRRRLAEPASVALAIRPTNASVSIDDHPVGAALAPGSHMLVASAPGRAAVRLPLVLAPGERRQLELDLPVSIPTGLTYVAAGSFLYGSRDGEGLRTFFGTAPLHEVHTDAFLIGTTEVTYAAWLEFVDALPASERSPRLPRVETSPTVGGAGGIVELREVAGAWTLRLSPASIAYEAAAGTPIVYRERLSRSRQDWRQMPVTGISPDDAQAYADWLDRTRRIPHARLCSEREWEHAMRGVDGRSYPHGDRLAPDEANFDKTYGQREGGFGPDVVGSHPASTSPYGLVDGSGNAAEIVRSGGGTGFVSRGGCFYTDANSAHLANRQEITPTYRHVQIGVRICADP